MWKVIKEVGIEISKKKIDSLVNIIALALALYYIHVLWLKIILTLFIVFSLYRISQSVMMIQKEKNIPLAVVVYGDETIRDAFIDDCLQEMEKIGFDEASYRSLGIDRDDWCISHPGDLSPNPEEWKRVVREFQRKINLIRAKLKGPEFFHIFLKCRTGLAFGLGAAIGTWHNVVIYQEIDGKFKPVIYLDNKLNHHKTHDIKTHPKSYDFIKFEIPENITSPTLVSLNLSSHGPTEYIIKEAKKRNLSCVIIENTYNNTLSEEDWFKPAQEVASVLLDLLKRAELEIYFSCPNAIAFAIGMALGDQSPAKIFQWFPKDNTYKFVLKLNELE